MDNHSHREKSFFEMTKKLDSALSGGTVKGKAITLLLGLDSAAIA